MRDGEQLALERVLVLHVGAVRDDRLADQRHLLEDGLAQAAGIGRHVAPADQALALVLDEALELLDDDVARLGLGRQEAHRHRIMARRRQRHARAPAQSRSRASGVWIRQPAPSPTSGSAPTPRGDPDYEELKALGNDFIGLFALDIGDETDAARVMLVAGVVKTLFRRQPDIVFQTQIQLRQKQSMCSFGA
ncbi:MAG: hypothetical protein WDN03_05280 [Rhizomicrobium sp.]